MRELTPARWVVTITACGASLLILLATTVLVGGGSMGLLIAIGEWFGGQPIPEFESTIIFKIRLPRGLLAICAGFTLSSCGVAFQGLLRNPLATPYTLGIASGASLGAIIAIKWKIWALAIGDYSVPAAAFVGAASVTAVVYGLARSAARLSTNELLLAGVTIGLFCSALSLFVQYVARPEEIYEMVRWGMGNLDIYRFRDLQVIFPFLLAGWLVLFSLVGPLNQIALGDEIATSRGIHVGRFQALTLFGGSLAAAAVVSVCGPIGFVGLIVPHATRKIVGSDHRILLPASALLGGAFLLLCDWVARFGLRWLGAATDRELSGAEIPVGVITAILGGPFFLVLLIRAGRSESKPAPS
jgi:iron complex transport system permease protein